MSLSGKAKRVELALPSTPEITHGFGVKIENGEEGISLQKI